MAKNRSIKSPFKSLYADPSSPWVSPSQYLAEFMVKRQAAKDGKTLTLKFWNNPLWKKSFLLQLRFANGLLKLYSATAIIQALNSPNGKKVFSLGAKWFDDTFAIFQAKYLLRKRVIINTEEKLENIKEEPVREAFVEKKSNLNKLRDLE